ncbi:carboxylesterase/lipase family protein [Streptomyces varsoviensis]|uniref:carboxylesterase/lipase family protein n=1 Tax=Streptomyces varsoviensis TaxID=67373 RepID=UPI0006626DFA|nr:carboxylesterase family protein [Streptomyces varsoviensis]
MRDARPVVRIGQGALRGGVSGSGSGGDGGSHGPSARVTAFKNIPYAAAPVGPLRFAAPAPAPSWDGTREADRFGPSAPQARLTEDSGLDLTPVVGVSGAEGPDSLTVNVWTPDPATSGLPVMVFIHGGGFVSGSGASRAYDGTRFAQDGVVLVTLNYRLGAHGFTALPGAPANLGLRDQIAALTWVRENIGAFGGDPDRVTVFGESAGAISVCSLLAAPQACGLFRAAISQSGGASHALSPRQAAYVTEALAARLGVPATRQGFESLTDEQLAQGALQLRTLGLDLHIDGERDPLCGLSPFGPVLDGELLGTQPVEAVRAGAAAGVRLMAGTNADEANLYTTGPLAAAPDEDQLVRQVRGLHPEPEAVIAAYRSAGRADTPASVLSAVITDYVFAVPTRRLIEAHAEAGHAEAGQMDAGQAGARRAEAGHAAAEATETERGGGTWAYEFAWPSPQFDGRLGACHTLELPFVFDYRGDDLTGPRGLLGPAATLRDPAVADLFTRVHGAWTRFATASDPGWPSCAPKRHVAQRLHIERYGPEENRGGPELAVWDGHR